jgi:Putative transposase
VRKKWAELNLNDIRLLPEMSLKYMIRPVLSLERLSFLGREGQVGYRWGQDRAEQERMDYLEFIARVTSHIPDKGKDKWFRWGDGGLTSLGGFSGRPQRRCRRRAHRTTIFLFLTSARGREYHFFVKGGNDSELNAGKVVPYRKANPYEYKLVPKYIG